MATRSAKAKIEYRNAKGEKARVTDSVAAIVFQFAHGSEHVIDVKALPKQILAAAAVRGVAEKIRDTYAGVDSSEGAQSCVEELHAQLLDGEWLTAREGGSGVRSTMLLTALKEALEKAGKPFDEVAQRAKLYADDDVSDEEKAEKAKLRSQVSKIPQVEAVLTRLKAEAAARRAEKAEPAGPTMGLDDL